MKDLIKLAVIGLFCCFFLPTRLMAVGPPPSITVQPLDQSVIIGGTVTFSVTATSSTTLTYQWYKDGVLFFDELLTGQTSSTLTIINVGSSDVGKYFVDISNAGGTASSRKASLSFGSFKAPVATNDSYSTSEDMPLIIPAAGVLTNDTDGNGLSLVAILMTNVDVGNLSLNTNGSFTYIPPTNFSGRASFTYWVSDRYSTVLEQNNSGANKIEIRSNKNGAQSFRHGTAGGPSYMINQITLYLSREPAIGMGTLSFSIGTGLNSNAITGTAISIFPTNISNTTSGSSFQTYVTSYASPVGPFTAGTTYYLNFANNTGKKVFAEYPNNNSYTNGTYYDDGANQNKDMRFLISEAAMSSPATVTINVLSVNDPPVASNDTYNTFEDTLLNVGTNNGVLANDNDPDGNVLSAVLVTNVTNGNLTFNTNGTFVYLPSTNYNGSDSFSYRPKNASSLGNITTVTINITSVNDDPVAQPDSFITSENIPLTVTAPGVLTNDTDVENNSLSAVLVTTVSHGTLNLNPNGSFTYTPSNNYFGMDSFTYKANDVSSNGTVALVSLMVRDTQTPLRFSSGEMSSVGFQFNMTGPWGYVCVVEASTNMFDWTPIFTNVYPSGSIVFTDADATNFPARYYRAVAY